MNRLLTTVMVGLAGIQGLTLEAESRPKLVVGILIDQLRTDYLEHLQDKFGTGGFRMLMDKGAFLKDVDFKIPDPDVASAAAIIQTGSYPRQNGITAELVYSPADRREISVFQDPAYIGNFTTETYSPASLRVTTLSDEISIANGGVVHSIAPQPAEAIILAGHVGNSAFWVNDETGKWATSTYYKNPPAYLQNINYNKPLVSRVDTMKWVPLKSNIYYPGVSQKTLKEGFRHTFSRSDRDVFSLYKSSPYVNSDIADAASEYIRTLQIGKKDEATDVLNIGFTLSSFPSVKNGDGNYELEDSYLRLDSDLARLFREIDKNVGWDNVLLYVASTGYYNEPERDLTQFRIPTGSFSVKRAISLVNAYLTAKYGNGSYIDRFSNRHLYLDKTALEARNLQPSVVANDARDFLVKMSGVADAFTLSELQSPGVSQVEGHRLANDPKTAGDIILEFNRGWTVTDDSKYPPETLKSKSTVYKTPAFFFGQGINPKIIGETVDATAIAPTVADILRIRPPNATVSKALQLK